MSFDQRNEAWNGQPRRFFVQPHSRSSSPRVWSIEVIGNQIHTTWGQLNGAMQDAIEHMKGVNEGKSNYKPPEVYALERSRETCRKKHWEGYREYDKVTGNFLDPTVEKKVDFNRLPLSLSFYKPDNTLGSGLEKKVRSGKALYTRKANGMMHVICRGDGLPQIYSRRMLRQHDDEIGTEFTLDHRFPHLIEQASQFMAPNSILLGDIIALNADGTENFALAQSYIKSLTPQALLDQQQFGWAKFYCWDVAFWDSQDLLSEARVGDRYDLLHEEVEGRHFVPIQIFNSDFFPTPEAAIEYAKKKRWEGFVVVDPEGIYADRGFNFKGKPDRPGAYCGKLKPEYEDDFIAIWNPECKLRDLPSNPIISDKQKNATVGERSTKGGSGQGIKSVALFQYNKEGRLVYISNVSSGLTDKMIAELSSVNAWPRVWQITYSDRRYMSNGDDTNALDFARFTMERTDKKVEECINQEL